MNRTTAPGVGSSKLTLRLTTCLGRFCSRCFGGDGPATRSIPSFNSLVESLALHPSLAGASQPHQHYTTGVPQSLPSRATLRGLCQHDSMVNIEKSRSELQQWACTSEDFTFLDETISTNTYGAAPARGICEQYSDLDAAETTSNRSTKRKKRHRSSSSPSVKQRKSKQGKIAKEKASRSNQATCLQNMEDFLECAVGWHAPKKQTPGNVKRSGMAGDKQQTMEAIIILCAL